MTIPTKNRDGTALFAESQLEVGLACNAGSSPAGIYGLTELLGFASAFAARRQNDRPLPPVRVTHWRQQDEREDVCCTFDSYPRPHHALSVLVIPGNEQAPTDGFLGPTVMLDTARFMNIDPPGREQRFYSDFIPRIKHGDAVILKAQQWLAAQREHPVAVTDIARYTCLEPRTLLRRFVSATGMKPSEYQQRLRISRAREMLEFSRKSVDEVATSVGYNDLGGFRRVFRKIVGLTPSEYRQRFCRVSGKP